MYSPGSRPNTRISVRTATVADSEDIARVCLMTAYQGRSAEVLVRHPELPSQVRALPYLHLPSGFAFILVESEKRPESSSESEKRPESSSESESETETEQDFEPESERDVESGSDSEGNLLLQRLFGPNGEGIDRSRSRNVVGYAVGTTDTAQFEREVNESWWPALRMNYPKDLVGTPLDRYFIGLIHKGPKLSSAGLGTAHIHVNVIGKYKKLGYNRLLVDAALQHLRKKSGKGGSSICL